MFNISLTQRTQRDPLISETPDLEFVPCKPENNEGFMPLVISFITEIRNVLSDQEGIKFSSSEYGDFVTKKVYFGLSTQSKRINEIIMDIIFLKGKYASCTNHMIDDSNFIDWKSAISLIKPSDKDELVKNLFQQELISLGYYQNFASNFCSLYELAQHATIKIMGRNSPHIEALPICLKIRCDLTETARSTVKRDQGVFTKNT